MSDFKKQIEEDIREYQENYKYISNIQKDEWAFNYWVLDKLFYFIGKFYFRRTFE